MKCFDNVVVFLCNLPCGRSARVLWRSFGGPMEVHRGKDVIWEGLGGPREVRGGSVEPWKRSSLGG